MSVGNPYVVERPLLEGDLSVGRYNTLMDVTQRIKRGQQVTVLWGSTRMGRTTFLHQLARELVPGFVPVLVNLVWPADGNIEQAIAQLQSALAESQRAWQASTEPGPETTLGAGREPPVVALVDGLTGADLQGDRGQAWVTACQTWLSSRPLLRLVLAIESSRPQGSILFSPALTSLPSVQLGGLSLDEAEELLVKPVHGRLLFEFDAVQRIWQLTAGHPYFVQLYGYALFDTHAGGGTIHAHDVEKAKDTVLAAAQAVMERMWRSCSAPAQVVMALANDLHGRHGIVSVPELQALAPRFGLSSSDASLDVAVTELQARGVLQQLSSGGYRFSLELFRDWLDKTGKTLLKVMTTSGYKTAPGWRGRMERSFRWSNVVLWAGSLAFIAIVLLLWNRRGTAERQTVGSLPTPTVAPFATRATLVIGPVMGNITYMAKDNPDATWDIWVMRGDGSDPRRITDNPEDDMFPAWAADGKKIAFVSNRDGNREIYVMKVDGTEQLNLTHQVAEDSTPAWSPDGTTVAFASYRDGNWEIYTMNADGSNPERLTRSEGADYAPCWSPDGQRIAFQSNRDGNWEIYVMARDGSGPQRLTEDEATDSAPAWSPDGMTIAFESYRDGNMEIYLMATDGSDQRNLTEDVYSNEHGPAWARGGLRLLYYSNRDGGWDLYSMKPDGTDRSNLTLTPAFEQKPAWHE